MAAVTLTTLRARARESADKTGSSFISDAANSLDAWINEGVQHLHEKLVEAMGEKYAYSTSSLSFVAGTTDYALPADFLKLYGVDVPYAGVTQTLRPYTFAERNWHKNRAQLGIGVPRYTILGTNLHIEPSLITATATLHYAPAAALLVNGSDTVNFPNGWERYVVIYAAMRATMKEESDASPLAALLRAEDERLETLIQDRDVGHPRKLVDIEATHTEDWLL